jgi:tetratricopeptide (TPR) repeat protein
MRAHFVGQLIGLDFSDSRHLSGILDDARQIRDRAFRYAAQFFAEVSRSGPIVLYFDDIHWADDGSLDFISYLARNCSEVPMLVLCLARTSLLERRPAWGEGEEAHALIRLQPLSKKESRQLVEEILRHAPNVPERLRDLVVSGAEGNPFYVEELIKMLIDQRVIVPGADEWRVDANRLGEVKVPPTLTGVLQARLDNLTPREYTALQRASVVGRVFWDSAVEHLGADSAETRVGEPPHEEISAAVAEVLESLRRKELIYRREGSSFAGANEYLFKHTLLRDVTYESVLRRERRAYHRRVAEWLILKSGGRVTEHAAHVAEHYEQAREERHAARWYARAGQQARETYAPEAAILYYRKALEFPPPLSASTDEAPGTGARRAAAVALYEGLGEVLRVQARYAESIAAYERMREAAAALGDRAGQARAWNEVALVLASQGDNRSTLDAARRAEALAREAGDDEQARVEMAHALSLQSQASTRLGDARAAMRLATQALTYATDLGEAGRRVTADSLKSLGMAHHILGNFERAEHYKEQALHTYRERGDRRGVGNLLNSLGETARLRGDYEAALRHYQEALSIAREIGNRNGEILYLSNLAAARTGLGDYAAAESDLRQTIELASAAGYFGLSENYRFLAEALLGQGQTEAALEAAHKALELGRELENQEHIGEAWRVLGLVAAHSSPAPTVGDQTFDAAACFAESLRVFAAIKMESERARTLREWARHELARGDRERGRDMWREARDIFTKLGMELEVARMPGGE